MIKNIKLGVKISIKNFDLIPEIYSNQEIIDFVEIILIPEFIPEDIKFIKSLNIPYVIHLPNSNNRIDFGDINVNNYNMIFINNINQNLKFLDELSPICYIVHPESGDINLSIQNIKKLKIAPIAIENMPLKGINGKDLLGYNPKSLKIYFDKIKNLEFCFDINHAIKAAISISENYSKFIKDFLKFKKPTIFHISGGKLNIEIDEHLSFDESQYNLFEIKKILLEYGGLVNLTFETPRNYEKKISDDIKNMKIFLKTDKLMQ